MWWACDHPERRHVDYETVYDHRCRACLIAMRAGIETGACGPYIIDVINGRPTNALQWLAESWPGHWEGAS
jgi:hypothetical protein